MDLPLGKRGRGICFGVGFSALEECAVCELVVNTKVWVKTTCLCPLHGWFLGLARKNWSLNQYSMIIADFSVTCVFAIPSV